MHYPQFCQKASGDFCTPAATAFVIALLTSLFCLLSIQWLDQPVTLWMAQNKDNLPVLQSVFKVVSMFGKGVAVIAPATVALALLWWLDGRLTHKISLLIRISVLWTICWVWLRLFPNPTWIQAFPFAAIIVIVLWLLERYSQHLSVQAINKFLADKGWMNKQLRKLCLRWSFLFWVAVLGSGILVNVLKFLIGRPRPELWLSQGLYGFDPLALAHAWHSLPSGHSTTAGAVAVFIWQVGGVWRTIALLYALLIAISRLVLLQHYLADVVAGLVFGALISWLLLKRYRPTKASAQA
ncbi:MAG: phosphatase PAP2 family protein [Alphaproteobacteria bacterium]|nr:phosphatase PAP2 family protein [Alphaproteobacteria bacterium]